VVGILLLLLIQSDGGGRKLVVAKVKDCGARGRVLVII